MGEDKKSSEKKSELVSGKKEVNLSKELPQFRQQLEDKYWADLAQCVSYLDEERLKKVRKALDLAFRAHDGQVRLSGDPYIDHLVEVTKILASYRLDSTTLCTGLLHDLIEENTGVSLDYVTELFGKELSDLIDDVTNLTKRFARQEHKEEEKEEHKDRRQVKEFTRLGGKEAADENLRKIFLVIARDLRAILVKFADRLHNLRTLEFCAAEVQKNIARETLDIFAPIASRLGVWEFKAELENLAFKYAFPEDYLTLSRELEEVRPAFVSVMDKIVATLREKLQELSVENDLEYRFKHLYSIYRKKVRSHKSLSEIYDLAAIRVLVPTVEDCYMIFGLVHSLWSPMHGRIKDYIAHPKPNNYRCLHTTVVGPDDVPVEIQIRTFEMHKVNEVGVAAHWAYKEGKVSADKSRRDIFADLYPWIRALLDCSGEDSSDVGEHVKFSVPSNEVFAFTPLGDVVNLPIGATPIDFAYRVHSEVGNRCVGALVNGRMVPLTYKLSTGDKVEIKTAKNGTPSRDWLRICTSHQALSKIRGWFKRERREENIICGREAVKAELKRLRLEELLNNEEIMLKAAQQLSFLSGDDLLASVGYGETSALQAVSRLQNALPKTETLPEIPLPDSSQTEVKRSGSGREVIVENVDTILTKMARCCMPVPGDEIIGYITVGSGVSVHRSDCLNFAHLSEVHPERIVKCAWNTSSVQTSKTYWVHIVIEAWDRSGLVGELLACLSDIRVSVKSCQALTAGDKAKVKLSVEVTGNKQLEEALKRLRSVKSVFSAVRSKNR
ncbi:MAG: RelA/SpoT family protein [Candidatus Bruticola sp.]